MSDKALTSRNGALWIQPNGPSPLNPVYLLGCHDLGDLTIPEGDISPLRCFKTDGSGWNVIGETTAPPDMPSTSIDTLLFRQRDWLEKMGPCAFSLYALARDCGDASVFSNYVRGEILTNARLTEKTYANLAKREEDVEMTLSVPIKGWEVLDVDDLHADLVAHASIVDQNDVIANPEQRCQGDCGDTLTVGQDVYTVTDGAGAAKPEVYLSTNEGVTFTAGATDPYAVADNVMAITRFIVGKSTVRLVIGLDAPAGAQGSINYSDDGFATAATTVNIGGAAAGHGVTYGGGLFALDQFHIWLASAAGYIYKSIDGAVTWTAVESAGVTAGDYTQVHFCNTVDGVAVAAAGIVATSHDGGDSWQAATVIGAGAAGNLTCQRFDQNRILVGDDAGKLWYSDDDGVTWTQITNFVGSGAGDVRDLHIVNDHVIWMITDSAAPVGTVHHTINGGYNWTAVDTPTNVGLNAIWAANEHLAYVVGNDNAGVSVTIKVHRD